MSPTQTSLIDQLPITTVFVTFRELFAIHDLCYRKCLMSEYEFETKLRGILQDDPVVDGMKYKHTEFKVYLEPRIR